MSMPSTRPSTPVPNHTTHPAHKLLTRAHPADPGAVSTVFTEKIINKPLLLSTSTDHADKRAFRRHVRNHKAVYARKHARPKPLSTKEKRERKLYELKPEECSYETYKGLNALWTKYILEVLGYLDREGKVVGGKVGTGVTAMSAGAVLAGADFHGMEVEVVRSVDAGRVGVRGIVVRETRSTFVVVVDQKEKGEGGIVRDKVRTIFKKGSVFLVCVDLPVVEVVAAEEGEVQQKTKRQLVFELHGDQLELRPIDRATKKFKWRPLKYL